MKNTICFYLLTDLENIAAHLSRDHGRNPRYWRGKFAVFRLSSFHPR